MNLHTHTERRARLGFTPPPRIPVVRPIVKAVEPELEQPPSPQERRQRLIDAVAAQVAAWKRFNGNHYREPIGPPDLRVAFRDAPYPPEWAFEDAERLFGVTKHEILSTIKTNRVVQARAFVAHRLKPHRSYAQLGRMLKRDHTSIMHLIASYDDHGHRRQH